MTGVLEIVMRRMENRLNQSPLLFWMRPMLSKTVADHGNNSTKVSGQLCSMSLWGKFQNMVRVQWSNVLLYGSCAWKPGSRLCLHVLNELETRGGYPQMLYADTNIELLNFALNQLIGSAGKFIVYRAGDEMTLGKGGAALRILKLQ